MNPIDLIHYKQAGEMTQRILDRARELDRSSNELDRRVARELFIQARDQSAAQMRELERQHPALKVIGKLLAKSRKRKAATGSPNQGCPVSTCSAALILARPGGSDRA